MKVNLEIIVGIDDFRFSDVCKFISGNDTIVVSFEESSFSHCVFMRIVFYESTYFFEFYKHFKL